jgi:phage replication initiation protein
MKSPFLSSEQIETSAPAPDARDERAPAAGADLPPTGKTGGKLWTYTDPDSGESFLICPKGKRIAEVDLIPLPSDGTHPYAAITDYLNCTFPFDPSKESLTNLFQELFELLGPKFAPAVDRQRKFLFYGQSFQLGESSVVLGIGGQAGTVVISFPGEACALISDWKKFAEYFRDRRHARITRWDGAVDDYEGIHTVDHAVELYKAKQFNAGGAKPSCDQKGNWLEPDGSGRTFYVGKRESGKMLRVYEKGMQLGGWWHPWVRWEIELHNTDRIVPWDVLLEPGRYFVGAYPKALGWAQTEMTRIQTIQKQTKISYEHLTSCAALAYGPLLNVMLEVEGNSDAVLRKLHRAGTPRRLQHPFVDKPSDFIISESSDRE